MKTHHPAQSLMEASRRHSTPAFWFNAKRVSENYTKFTRGIPGIRVFYPLKVNSDKRILELLAKEGSSFDAASLGEIKLALKAGATPDRIIFTTPVKSFKEVKSAARLGIKVFVIDSLTEIDKIADAAPGSKILVRIQTSNKGSQWPLSRRFGIEHNQAASLFQFAVDRKLTPIGITFHVGSQCIDVSNWRIAIRRAAKIMKDFSKKNGQELTVLNVGGGFPVCYKKDVPSLQLIFDAIRTEVKKNFSPMVEIWAEPGRAVVADAAFAVATVIGRTKRGHKNWLFCDLGAFNGLLELIEPSSKGFGYEIYAPSPKNGNGKEKTFIITGPSCDGDDILAENVELPNIGIGDRIYFLKTGAYSFAYGSRFCGNVVPKIYVV